jgi:hypothetical protein
MRRVLIAQRWDLKANNHPSSRACSHSLYPDLLPIVAPREVRLWAMVTGDGWTIDVQVMTDAAESRRDRRRRSWRRVSAGRA